MNRMSRSPMPGAVDSRLPAQLSNRKPLDRSQATTSDCLTIPSSGTSKVYSASPSRSPTSLVGTRLPAGDNAIEHFRRFLPPLLVYCTNSSGRRLGGDAEPTGQGVVRVVRQLVASQ
jgi:hypothetical protein